MVKNIAYNNNGVVTMISEQELNDILALANLWNFQGHFTDLSQQHTDYFETIIRELGYIDRADVNMTALFDNSYQEEAIALVKYWTESYALLEAYKHRGVTELTQLHLQDIISPFVFGVE